MNESVRENAKDATLRRLRRENSALRQDLKKLTQGTEERNELLHLTSFALNRVREAAYLIDKSGNFVFVNEEACERLACKREEMSQMGAWDINPDWTPTQWSDVLGALRGQCSTVTETLHCRKDGRIIPVQVSASYLECGGKEYGLVLTRDLTEYECENFTLWKSQLHYQQLFDNVADVIYLLDVTPESRIRILEINPAGAELLGTSRAALPGKFVDEVVPANVAHVLIENFYRCVESGMSHDDLLTLDLPGGRRHYQSTLIPESDESGRIHRIVGIARDITRLTVTERALRDSEQAFRTLAENAPDAIVRYDRNCRRTYVNPEFARMCAVDAEKLPGEPENVMGSADEVAQVVQAKLKAIMESGVAAEFEVNWIRYGQPQCWYAHAVSERDADGVVQSVLTIWRNMTELKQAEQQLRDSYELLRELTERRERAREEERKRIAREMHDELGQYLSALRMRISTLSMRFADANPELGEHIRQILILTDRTMQVLRDVIAALHPAVLNEGIVAALEWLAAEFSNCGHTACSLSISGTNWVLSEDRAVAIFRIVQEALTNVTRHANARQVSIELMKKRDDYLLEVRDDGRGFDPLAIRRKSFGLAGMKERVLMLGGALDVVSSPGHGTSIKIRLPLH